MTESQVDIEANLPEQYGMKDLSNAIGISYLHYLLAWAHKTCLSNLLSVTP